MGENEITEVEFRDIMERMYQWGPKLKILQLGDRLRDELVEMTNSRFDLSRIDDLFSDMIDFKKYFEPILRGLYIAFENSGDSVKERVRECLKEHMMKYGFAVP